MTASARIENSGAESCLGEWAGRLSLWESRRLQVRSFIKAGDSSSFQSSLQQR
jgi:hypothetical protein